MKGREDPVYTGDGFCPICEREVVFVAESDWFRDYLLCSGCASIPRERALMRVLADCYPDFRNMVIHESSPVYRGASEKLKRECPGYTASHFFEDFTLGQVDTRTGFRCESLESLTFEDDSFDIFVTQDVMEHVFNPDQAFREICRVLKPGGAHIFTVPLVNKHKQSAVWAKKNERGEIVNLQPAEYHQNDLDEEGALVTMHWGYDIVAYIAEAAGMPSTILTINDMSQGISAELIEVVVSYCPEVTVAG